MFISSSKYYDLVNKAELKEELEEEVKRLAEMISAEVKDCKIGPWCKECTHLGRDRSILTSGIPIGSTIYGPFISEIAGNVVFCKKHIHEQCPEFEAING